MHAAPLGPQNVETTLFGGKGEERVQGVQVLTVGANAGRILICGETTSDFLDPSLPNTQTPPIQHPFSMPLLPGYDTIKAGPANTRDAYVAILDEGLEHVLYWTYLGGDGDDRAYAATEDSAGNIWVCGFTSSLGALDPFPSTQCYKENGWTNCTPPAGWTWMNDSSNDAFVVKLPPDLTDNTLLPIRATIIGGSNTENCRGTLTVSGQSPNIAAYISGFTYSADFPASPGLPAAQGNTGGPVTICSATETLEDAFVVKLNDVGVRLWSRCLGGTGSDRAFGNCRIDPVTGDLFIGGCTRSTSLHDVTFDTPISVWGSLGGAADGFVAKVSSGSGKIYALRFHGGSGTDWVAFNDCLELDLANRPVVIGITRSLDFPLTDFPLSRGHSNKPGYSNGCPNAVTTCPSGPTPPTIDCHPDWNDVFIAKFANDLSSFVYSSYINQVPGSAYPTACHREEPAGLAIQRNAIYIAGETDSVGFPIAGNSYDTQLSCGVSVPCSDFHDAFFAKIFAGIAAPSVLNYSSFFGGDVGVMGATESGNRARCVSILTVSSLGRQGMPIFSGVTTMSDFNALTTPGVLFPTWLATDMGQGFLSIPDTD